MSKKKAKKTRAQKMAEVAEGVMRDTFDGFLEGVADRAAKGDSQAEWSAFGLTDGQLETLRKMFEREGFGFTKNLTATFTIKW